MFCDFCQSFGAYEAIRLQNWCEQIVIVSSLCQVHEYTVIITRAPSLRYYIVLQWLCFWQTPSVEPSPNGFMELFVGAGTCVHPSYCRVGALKVVTKSGLTSSRKECMEAIEVIVFMEWSVHVTAVILYVPGCFYFPFLKIHNFFCRLYSFCTVPWTLFSLLLFL